MAPIHDSKRHFTPSTFQEGSGECLVETPYQVPEGDPTTPLNLNMLYYVCYTPRAIPSYAHERKNVEALSLRTASSIPEANKLYHFIPDGYNTLLDSHLAADKTVGCRLLRKIGTRGQIYPEYGEVITTIHEAEWWIVGEAADPLYYREELASAVDEIQRRSISRNESKRSTNREVVTSYEEDEAAWDAAPTEILQKKCKIVRTREGPLTVSIWWG